MKLHKWVLAFLVWPVCAQLHGQDTLSVYFDFGQSRIPESQLQKLNLIPVDYDLSDLDSVHFIGMTDLVGDEKANIRLSRKRAENVARYCARSLPRQTRSMITALGEQAHLEHVKNRRVDIILYFHPAQAVPTEHEDTAQAEKLCYTIDYKLLHNCHLRTVVKQKKEMIMIETSLPDLKKKKEHYYGSRTSNGTFTLRQVKWLSKSTGNLWWQATRYVAEIPKQSFDSCGIFRIGDPPCDSCHENFPEQGKALKEDTCSQVDRFLMKNIQFRIGMLNRKQVKIRAPKAYVNTDDRYFAGCNSRHELIWEMKRGKGKQHYYYSALPKHVNYIANITRIMTCCKNDPEPSGCDQPVVYCQTLGEQDRSFVLFAEAGTHYQRSAVTPYAGLGISKEGANSRVSALGGMDINFRFNGSLIYQYHLMSFPFSALSPFKAWQSSALQPVLHRYARLYLGTELKAWFQKVRQDYLEQNLHLGLAYVHTNREALIPRIFVHYGLGFGYPGPSSARLYSIVQLGVNVKLARLNPE